MNTNNPAKGTENNTTVWIIIGIVVPTLIVLTTIATIALVILVRKFSQQKTECDNSYSTLSRGPTRQLQPQSLHTPNDLYDHIQLSPSTGQAEFISKTETDNTNNPSPHHHQNSIHQSVDTEQPKSVAVQVTTVTASSKHTPSYEKQSSNGQPTYAVVNKNKEQKNKKKPVHCPPKTSAATSLTFTKLKIAAKVDQPILCNQEIQQNIITKQIPLQTAEPLEELYTAVRKKTKESTAQNEEEPLPIPPQEVEQLYIAANKKAQPNKANEVESPPIPPHTVEELYTAVMKKPKAREIADEVEAPPVPPHTVEELYTAVQKK